ncbi:MAG: hypothetical protein JXA15_09755 [Spirochaetales bacterium]|nr:hypothetical protein [Spirochaetales bacterium]
MFFNELVESYDAERRERDVFHDLMAFRVREILLVASLYDSFILESDGALSERIYGEYFSLNLSSAPRVSCAYTGESALEQFRGGRFDMVVIMAGMDFDGPLATARDLRDSDGDTPILLLAMNNTSLATLDLSRPELSAVDRVFVWNGYSKLFVGMVKYVEDLRNVEDDTRIGLVRVVLLVEDSTRYYSRYLPLLYSVVMRQTQALIEEERLVDTYKVLRMRGRPKVLHATTYEEACELFDRYRPYLLAVISDVRFPRAGCQDGEAGFTLLERVKAASPDLPVLIQSAESSNRERAFEAGASFVDKNSDTLAHELGEFFRERLGFGPFVFRTEDGAELARARNMDEFEALLKVVPEESLLQHGRRNHFSAWLMARGEIRFARLLRSYTVEDFPGPDEIRGFLTRLVDEVRRGKSRGMLPNFDEAGRGAGEEFFRLGSGSVGGKGRGILFLKSLVDNLAFAERVKGIDIRVPPTAFIGIDEFERFLESNGLWHEAYHCRDHAELRRRFLAAPLPHALVDRLRRLVDAWRGPLAVRSSGLFEDMLMVPFSGIYDTYLIPNAHPDPERRLATLCDAVRLIYASIYGSESRAYFAAARYKIEEERMAVLVQQVVGSRSGRWFWPAISGTAQSRNYYPVSYLKSDDGLCVAALGLGSWVVDGGPAFRFSPRWPKLDVVSPEHRLDGSQHAFMAIDMERYADLSAGEAACLSELPVEEASADHRARLAVSTFDAAEGAFVPGFSGKGPRLVDFANILKHDAFPFAQAVEAALDVGAKSMGIPVEIEYALDWRKGETPVLHLLQLKPLMQNADKVEIELGGVDRGRCFLATNSAMGNGRDGTVRDLLVVEPGRFDRARTWDIAAEIGELDAELRAAGRRHLLVGPGRWGTRDPWLGVPVSFAQISGARAIVEADLPEFRVDSSLGSHFFHNLTSMNVGYFHVPRGDAESFVDWDWLAAFEPARRTAHCARYEFADPFEILMDGRSGRALVLKPAPRAAIVPDEACAG